MAAWPAPSQRARLNGAVPAHPPAEWPSCGPLFADPGQRLGRGNDRNASVGAEDEEVGIAGNDEIGPGRDGERQDGIVIGIAELRCQCT